ncbi:alpha/beta fold hydrolase [Agromyces sp. C10]|uniref:alpha/beta fold hydrolase n=1 Tax=Agromyces sp. C10 TaxID=2935077 RepID=UPI00200B8FC5|nr:alpha/beta fold hydrolase [Agromyces sp. C10]MCK8609010.1 alpha/beta hydrolase [Agromyces sp. C10]
MSAVPVEVWGSGERVVLVHGSLATGPAEWAAQRPLADHGYELVIPTRRAYAGEPGAVGEDFLTDGDDVAALLGDGAHLVGHSYGGLVAMVAAARRPQAVRTLVLAEPPAFDAASTHPAVRRLRRDIEQALESAGDDREFLDGFLELVGSPVDEIPADVMRDLTALVPALRRARQPWSGAIPVEEVRDAAFPTVVVSGDHHEAFTAMCDGLARDLGADHRTVTGAGHEIQLAAADFNALLLALWRSTAPQ